LTGAIGLLHPLLRLRTEQFSLSSEDHVLELGAFNENK
jgi:hypothetical protein